MTTAATPTRLITADEFLEMEHVPGKRYELIRGVATGEYDGIIRRCGDVVSRCGYTLFQYNQLDDRWDMATGDPGYILERNPDTVRCVDVALIERGRKPAGITGFPEFAPDLCVEVAYVGDLRACGLLSDKAQMWLDFGAREVWGAQPGRRHRIPLPPRAGSGRARRGRRS